MCQAFLFPLWLCCCSMLSVPDFPLADPMLLALVQSR